MASIPVEQLGLSRCPFEPGCVMCKQGRETPSLVHLFVVLAGDRSIRGDHIELAKAERMEGGLTLLELLCQDNVGQMISPDIELDVPREFFNGNFLILITFDMLGGADGRPLMTEVAGMEKDI